jgi:hypothetical protein
MAKKKLSEYNKKTRVKINTVRRAMASPNTPPKLAAKSKKILSGDRGAFVFKQANRFGAISPHPNVGGKHKKGY